MKKCSLGSDLISLPTCRTTCTVCAYSNSFNCSQRISALTNRAKSSPADLTGEKVMSVSTGTPAADACSAGNLDSVWSWAPGFPLQRTQNMHGSSSGLAAKSALTIYLQCLKQIFYVTTMKQASVDISAIVSCKPEWLRGEYKSYPAIPVAGGIPAGHPSRYGELWDWPQIFFF